MGQINSDMLQKMSIACSDLYAILVVGLTSGGFFFFRAPRISDLYAHANSRSQALNLRPRDSVSPKTLTTS